MKDKTLTKRFYSSFETIQDIENVVYLRNMTLGHINILCRNFVHSAGPRTVILKINFENISSTQHFVLIKSLVKTLISIFTLHNKTYISL